MLINVNESSYSITPHPSFSYELTNLTFQGKGVLSSVKFHQNVRIEQTISCDTRTEIRT